nr:hypothetical protein [Rosenbergiella epipactidis]
MGATIGAVCAELGHRVLMSLKMMG